MRTLCSTNSIEFVGLFLLVIPSIVIGETLHVPEDYPSIQSAVNAGNPGDTVLIADGNYTLSSAIEINGKNITIQSENGPRSCIIDCNGSPYTQRRGFTIRNCDSPGVVLNGLSIINGSGIREPEHFNWRCGGGVFCDNSDVIILDCILRNHVLNPGSHGGAICVFDSTIHVMDSHILDNYVDGDGEERGGGIYSWDSALTILNSCFQNNQVGDWNSGSGGAIWLYGGSTNISDCSFSRNSTQGEAGAIHLARSTTTIQTCTFSENQTAGRGGALWIQGPNSTIIINCEIHNNSGFDGGGIKIGGAPVSLVNTVLAENNASLKGDGLSVNNNSLLRLENCTIANNEEGVYLEQNAVLKGDNCVIWDEIRSDDNSSTSFHYSNLTVSVPGVGNISENPLFENGSTYRIIFESPCINAGSNGLLPLDEWDIDKDGNTSELIPLDVLGNDRVVSNTVDMGAYEYQIPPENDQCETAIELTCHTLFEGTTEDAHSDLSPFFYCNGVNPKREVWYKQIGNGRSTQLTTLSDTPMGIAVYRGHCEELQCITASSDNIEEGGQYTNSISICSAALVPYYIAVWGEEREAEFSMFTDCGLPCSIGACCMPDESCVEVSQPECNGAWKGTGIECSEITCTESPSCDIDLDGDVDLEDFSIFQNCFTGNKSTATILCDCDGDGDVDPDDFHLFQRQMKGPAR